MGQQRVWWLLVPGLVFLAVFLLTPLLYTFGFAFGSPPGLAGYAHFFRDPYSLKVLVWSLRMALQVSLIAAVLGLPVAYYISRSSKRARSIFLACAVFPLLTNAVVRAFAWMTLLGKNGLINALIQAIGWSDHPIKLLYTEFAVTIGTLYLFLPLMIVSLVGVMEHIDPHVIRAAQSLGANPIGTFFRVTLPLSLPGLVVGLVLVFTGSLTAYSTPQLLGGDQNMVLSTRIYQLAISLGDWQGASVIATVMMVLTIVVIAAVNAIAARMDRGG